MKTTQNIRDHIGKSISITWGTSRGRDSYGYTTAVLRDHNGKKIAATCGGGYDMQGTVVGDWLARTFPNELRKLKEKDMPSHSHWQNERARVCDAACKSEFQKLVNDAIVADKTGDEIEAMSQTKLTDDCYECPTCKGRTRPSNEGKTIDDGHYLYGLTFHDPNYDPGKAVIGKDCSDRTLTKDDVGSEGKTVADAEKSGNSFGLERLQAAYKASSKFATKRHTIPSIDGACGISSVMKIANAIGISLNQVTDRKNLDVYVITKFKPSKS